MTAQRVPSPCNGRMPYTRLDYTLMTLLSDERGLSDRAWVEHAYGVMDYLEGRLTCYPGEVSLKESRRRSRAGSLARVDPLPGGSRPIVGSEGLPAVA
jgi:hypothetical protein